MIFFLTIQFWFREKRVWRFFCVFDVSYGCFVVIRVTFIQALVCFSIGIERFVFSINFSTLSHTFFTFFIVAIAHAHTAYNKPDGKFKEEINVKKKKENKHIEVVENRVLAIVLTATSCLHSNRSFFFIQIDFYGRNHVCKWIFVFTNQHKQNVIVKSRKKRNWTHKRIYIGKLSKMSLLIFFYFHTLNHCLAVRLL